MRDLPAPFPWRQPDEETEGLYPGLVVHDGRVSGSITIGPTRLPIWAIPLRFDEWDEYADGHSPISERDAVEFVHNLIQSRGEFARLLLVLAESERTERLSAPWWTVKRRRKAVRDQLLRCLNCLGVD